MKKPWIVVIGLALNLALAGDALAMLKIPEIKMCNAAFASIAVVHAKVREHTHVPQADDPEGAPHDLYHLDVIKTYRGPHADHLLALSEMGGDNVQLGRGKEYILFTYKDEPGQVAIFNQWGEVGGGLVYSKANERKLLALLAKKSASIEGRIVDHESHPMEGAALTIDGDGRSYVVRTDRAGDFKLTVPPGTYRLLLPPKMNTTSYSPDANFYGRDSDAIAPMSLVGGQCMQVHLKQD